MGGDEEGSARSFIASARFNSDKAVLHQIDATDCVSCANFVEQFDQRHRVKLHSVYGDRNSLAETYLHLLFTVRRLLRRASDLPGCGQGSIRGVFQFAALVTDVP